MIRLLKQGFMVLLILFGPAVEPVRPDVFQWTDAHGVRHFSNISPPERGEVSRVEERLTGRLSGTRFRVVKIFDGDTIKVTGAGLTFKVRLVGIDAPETGWKGQAGQPFAHEATQILTRLLTDRSVRLAQYGTGGYNRILAEVFTNGKNINLEMVQKGMAEVYRGRLPKDLDRSAYRAFQDLARRNRAGIWSLGRDYVSPRDWRKAHPRD